MKGVCEDCGDGEVKKVHKNRKTGKTVCGICCRKDPNTHEKCFGGCKKKKPVVAYNEFGAPLCVKCYNEDPTLFEKCSGCDKDKPVHTRKEDGSPLCHSCYQPQWRAKKHAT